MSIGALLNGLQERAFGALLILLAVAAIVPNVPGWSGLVGVVMAGVAVQMLLGRARPWLPARLLRMGFRGPAFRRTVSRLLPVLARVERLVRPRLPRLAGRTGERCAGALVALLSVVIALPVPLVGNVPPAVVIIVLAIALSEQDGVVLLVGAFGALISLLLAAGVVAGLLTAVDWAWF